jgi:hypothetical protein
MAKVIIKIKNGIAESVEDIPTDISIEVRNYDVTNAAEDRLTKDANDEPCHVKEWHAPE